MKERKLTDVPRSIRDQLNNLAKQIGRPYNELEQYYAMERFLFRLGCSPYADDFVLKGALMLHAWGGPLARSTRDIDLLGRKSIRIANLVATVRDCVTQKVPEDGIRFDPASVTAGEIQIDAKYRGIRVHLRGTLGTSRLNLQVDVGFGDVIVPDPKWFDYPALLNYGSPHVLGYSPESVIAEKLQAIVVLDAANSRMKDFLDISALAQTLIFDGAVLCKAIQATFSRRETPLPTAAPFALTLGFAESSAKEMQWKAFLRKARLTGKAKSLPQTIEALRNFLLPPLEALTAGLSFNQRWRPRGPWSTP